MMINENNFKVGKRLVVHDVKNKREISGVIYEIMDDGGYFLIRIYLDIGGFFFAKLPKQKLIPKQLIH